MRDLINVGPYDTRRDDAAFLGLDMDAVSRKLDQHLSPKTPVALGPSVVVDREFGADFWYRATAALYPRRVVGLSEHTLELASSGASSKDGVLLGRINDGRSLRLVGPTDPHAAVAGITTSHFDGTSILAGATSVYGLGALVLLLCRQRSSVPLATLAGALIWATAAHTGTWLQMSVPWSFVATLGLGGAVLHLATHATSRPGRVDRAPDAGVNPWSIVPLVIVVLALLRGAQVPVTEWDGRFVWLFHAKQLFFRGFLDLAESLALGPLQPTYPLLTPSLFVAGSSWSGAFNERTAVILGLAFHAVIIGAIYRIAALDLGSFRAALFTSLVAGPTLGWTAEAYADGLLASLLVLQFLALGNKEDEPLGWLAMACAALTKREGLILAVIVILTRGRWRDLKPMAPALFPAALHLMWCRFAGLSHELDAPRMPVDLPDLVARTILILRKSAGVVTRNANYLFAGAALMAFVPRRPRHPWTQAARSSLATSLFSGTFILVTFLLTPQPLRWHLDTALPRLTLHPSMFALLGSFLISGSSREGSESARLKRRALEVAWALQRHLAAPWRRAPISSHREEVGFPDFPLSFPSRTRLGGDEDLGYGYLDRWRRSMREIVSPAGADGTRIQLFSFNAPDTPPPTHPHVMVDARNLTIDFGEIGRRSEPKHRPGYLRATGAFADYRKGALIAEGFAASPPDPDAFPRDHLRDIFGALTVVERAPASDQVISDPCLVMTREPHEYTNLFHAHTDWLSAFTAVRLLDLEEFETRVLLLDRHPSGPLDASLRRLFSRAHAVSRLDDFGSQRVLFRRAIFVSPGYSSVLWSRQYASDPGAPVGFLQDYGRYFRSAFGPVTDTARPGPVRVTLLVRRPYPGKGPVLMRRFESELSLLNALQSLPDVAVRAVDPAAFSLPEQTRLATETEILIGAHGAGLAHTFALPSHGAVVEIVAAPAASTYRLFPNIAAWTGRECRRIECPEIFGLRGSVMRPNPEALRECVRDLLPGVSAGRLAAPPLVTSAAENEED